MQYKIFLYSILTILFFSCNGNLHSQNKAGTEFSVKVVGITDGDTFKGLTDDNQQIKFRIYGIDAPEKKQAFGNRSKQTLSDLIFGKTVHVKVTSKDRWGRSVARIYTMDNKDISAEMIRAGMAWHFKKYSNDAQYAELENQARKLKTGLWADANPVAPWYWRKNKTSIKANGWMKILFKMLQ